MLAGICYMPVVRNKLLKRFLVSEYTDLVFLDADIGWNPKDLVRLLLHDKDVVAAAAPFRANPEGYPSSLIMKDGKIVQEDGLLESAIAATAFMRIRKQVFGLFIEEFGEKLIISEKNAKEEETDRYLNIFDTGQIGDKWWGEDTRFCDVYRKLGGRIWIDPEIPLTHTGTHTWSGHFGDFLRRNGHL